MKSAEISSRLSRLQSKKNCVLIHSCYAGAFKTPVQSATRAGRPYQPPANAPDANGPFSHWESDDDDDDDDDGAPQRSATSAALEQLNATQGTCVLMAGPPDKVTYSNFFPDAVRASFEHAWRKKERLSWLNLTSNVSTFMREHYADLDQYLEMSFGSGHCSDFDLWIPRTAHH